MEHQVFDDITRALGTSTSRRQMFKTVSRVAVGAVGAWLSWNTIVPARPVYASSCQPVLDDGSCPPGTEKEKNPNNTPTYNGCGPEEGILHFILPQSYGNAPFTPSCNNHDLCYEDCFIDKDTCDYNFFEGMVKSCTDTYNASTQILDRGWCCNMGLAYFEAVSQGGGDAWISAQKKACECMPSQVYCGCNKKCYPTSEVQTCLDECHSNLGCFNQICGPASVDTCPC